MMNIIYKQKIIKNNSLLTATPALLLFFKTTIITS